MPTKKETTLAEIDSKEALKAKMAEVKATFDADNQKLTEVNKARTKLTEVLIRLQGQYDLLKEMIGEEEK